MFTISDLYNSASSYSAKPGRIQPILCLLYFIIMNNLSNSQSNKLKLKKTIEQTKGIKNSI